MSAASAGPAMVSNVPIRPNDVSHLAIRLLPVSALQTLLRGTTFSRLRCRARHRRDTFIPATTLAPKASRQREGQLAELLDRGGDLVAGLEPDLLVLRLTRDHALGGAGED